DAFWPGPLTLILRRAPGVLDAVTGGQDTVGLRVPRHPVARELLRAFGGGVAAPSANRFGRISPTTAAHVRADLGERVDAILDGGPSEVGLESTILDLSGREPRILRPGGITAGQLAKVLGRAPAVGGVGAPRVSGSLASHYAPRTPAVVVRDAAAYARHHPGRRLGVLARRDAPEGAAAWRRLPDDAAGYGRQLYAGLRELDALACDEIVIEAVPAAPEWLAVRDRLRRAARRED
ncbi:MAG TPA: L-threonylcarbamoyladenylate synthase, partial [Trueperaceae bacterium]